MGAQPEAPCEAGHHPLGSRSAARVSAPAWRSNPFPVSPFGVGFNWLLCTLPVPPGNTAWV